MPPFVLKEFEAENFQCVDVSLGMRVEGVIELLQHPFVVIDAPALVSFPCCYGATCLRLETESKQNRMGLTPGLLFEVLRSCWDLR